MDVREKLVELLNEANSACVGTDCFEGCKFYAENDCLYKLMADVMIAHGVTVQSEVDANTYQLMREIERLKEEKESLVNAVNMLEEINSDLCKKLKGATVQEWYPASNPPKEDGTYLVQTNTGTITTARFYAFKSFPATKYLPACHRSPSWQSNRNVVKWTFLPQPPKGE